MNGWLIALSVVGGVLLLLILVIALGKVRIRILYEKELIIQMSVFGLPKSSFPSVASSETLKASSQCKNPDRLWRKEQKRLRKLAKKHPSQKPVAAPSAEPKPNLIETVDMVFSIIKRVFFLTKGKLHVEFHKFYLRVATDNAASTAILYGVVTQNTAYLLQWLQENFNELHRKPGAMTVEADFLSETPSVEIDLRLRIGLLRAIFIDLEYYRIQAEEKRRAKKRAKKRIAKQAKKETT